MGRRAAAPRREERLFRVVDANLNRAKEGLRVCEDLLRFVFDDATGTRGLRAIRHGVTQAADRLGVPPTVWIATRRAEADVGRAARSLPRSGVSGLLLANLQRAKEALRVLEECAKVLDGASARRFEALRFSVYAWEARLVQRLPVVRRR